MTAPRRSVAGSMLLLLLLVLGCLQEAHALPAFARKYGLRCSACHESWPMLNYFGQKFKDNGYQLMNDRDAPIWQNPSYWPVTFRITPIWHRVSTGRVAVDQGTGQNNAEARIESSGFDLSGLDFHTGGTLEKNFSFYVLPSSDNTGSFHFETAMARLDNLFSSPWLNVKLGKFELDNLLSEKRILTLTGNGGIYQTYHFIPVGDNNIYGQIGDNQLGVEYMGHSMDDRTRVSAALISSSDGNVGLITGANSYTDSSPRARPSTRVSWESSESGSTKWWARQPRCIGPPPECLFRALESATRDSTALASSDNSTSVPTLTFR